jgi:cell shape-determining protein MreC
MHDVVFKLAIAVILAAAIMFMLATSFSQLEQTSNTTVSNVEQARQNSLANSISYLQQ